MCIRDSGCVIHKVVAGVDEGDILFEDEIPANNLEVDDIFRILKDRSYRLWCIFLKDKLWSKE